MARAMGQLQLRDGGHFWEDAHAPPMALRRKPLLEESSIEPIEVPDDCPGSEEREQQGAPATGGATDGSSGGSGDRPAPQTWGPGQHRRPQQQEAVGRMGSGDSEPAAGKAALENVPARKRLRKAVELQREQGPEDDAEVPSPRDGSLGRAAREEDEEGVSGEDGRDSEGEEEEEGEEDRAAAEFDTQCVTWRLLACPAIRTCVLLQPCTSGVASAPLHSRLTLLPACLPLVSPARRCGLCDDGGNLISCDGVCMRAFHYGFR